MLQGSLEISSACSFNTVRNYHQYSSPGIRSEIRGSVDDGIEERGGTLRLSKSLNCLLKFLHVTCQGLSEITIRFNGIDRRFVNWSHDATKEIHRRMFFKFARR